MSLVRVAWGCITASFVLTALAALGVVLALSRQDLGHALQRDGAQQAASLARESQLPGATLDAVSAVARQRATEGQWALLSITPLAANDTRATSLQRSPEGAAPAQFIHLIKLDTQLADVVTTLGPPEAPFASMRLVTAVEPSLALLWHLTWSLALTFMLTGALLVAVLAWVVRWAKAPLVGFGEQVRALAEMRFVSMAEPRISEWVGLAKALNVLVGRVQAMLLERETRLSDMRQRTEQDAIAGVASRDAFVDHLKLGLARGSVGAVAIVRVHDLIGMNQRVGRERTDDFLQAVATVLRARLYPIDAEAPSLGRLNGADFGIVLPMLSTERLNVWLQDTATTLQSLHEQQLADSVYVAWIGASTVIADERFSDVLSRVDNMVMASEMRHQPYCLGSANQPLERIAIAQWRVMIETALDTGRCEIALYPVKARAGGVSHLEAMLRLRGADDTLIPASAFIPPAVRTGRSAALDLRAIELAGIEIGKASHNGSAVTVAVKVSPHSIRRPIFVERLREILSAARFDTSRLWIEIDESGLADSRDSMASLGELLREFRCRLGIAHFGRHFSALPELAAMAVDYVKLDASFCHGVSRLPAKQAFVRVTTQMAAALGIDVIAEGVADEADLQVLETFGVAGATGPWVSTLLAGSIEAQKA
jgi:EAL domain-containing protein (putative c-di-GMP-specific phosphodiesterase class I)